MASNVIVTVNAGSSSIKLVVFTGGLNVTEMSRLLDISMSNIGQPISLLQIKHAAMDVTTEEVRLPSYTVASDIILQKLAEVIPVDTVIGIGHRLVHGGGKFTRPTLLKIITGAEPGWCTCYSCKRGARYCGTDNRITK